MSKSSTTLQRAHVDVLNLLTRQHVLCQVINNFDT